jgi:GT2 family glycosyltransferase
VTAQPRVSVIMPCLNGEAHVQHSIDSVLAQTAGDFELIVVDNGSADGTLEVLAGIADPRLRVLSQPERGVSRARNLGVAAARAGLIAFLDSDDTWSPLFLERMCDALAQHPAAVLAYCGWQNVGLPAPRGEPFTPPDYETPDKAATLLGGCRWPIHGCVTRAEAIKAVGGFDPALMIAEDYLLWMEVAVRGPIVRVPEVLAYYHHHGGPQATRNRARAGLDTLRAKHIFLARHPDIAATIPPQTVEALTWGKLIEEGNALYWRGDYENARPIFRKALAARKGSYTECLRMLPSLLPLPIHRALGHAKRFMKL